MKTIHLWIKRFAKLGLMLMMGVSMSACSATMRWKEEVLLHDGQVIVAERHYNLGGYAYLDSSERTPLNETVTFNLPGTNKQIIWKNDFNDAVPEPNSLNHFRFDVVKGIPYLATYPAGCISYNKWGRPNPPQVLFKYEGEQWRRIALAELPPELVGTSANVIVGRPASSLLKPFYTVEGVNSKNYYVRTPEYKTILREAIPNVWSGCGEMIRKGNGGWDGIGWFSDQPSKEACLKYCERKEVSAQDCPCNRLFKGK
ncbi:MAG: hypothetical protein IPM27_01435 [Nitrosomonadales bacterium]|nr:hypothetical protein [Nitrosomonadales bacterium]